MAVQEKWSGQLTRQSGQLFFALNAKFIFLLDKAHRNSSQRWGFANTLTFAFMHHPYLVCILFFSCFYTFLVLISVTARPKSNKSALSSLLWKGPHTKLCMHREKKWQFKKSGQVNWTRQSGQVTTTPELETALTVL